MRKEPFTVEQCRGQRDTVTGCMQTALRIAMRYPNRPPTVADLKENFGMCRATAYRWIRGYKEAKGLPHGRSLTESAFD